MIERTASFLANQDRVKVGHFTRQGFDLGGVVHVGANNGHEIPYYLLLGAPRVAVFEPLPLAIEILRARFGNDQRVQIFPFGLSDQPSSSPLFVTEGTGKGSSFLEESNPVYQIHGHCNVTLLRFDSLDFFPDIYEFSTLVIDVQGMELEVLRGFGEQLQQFSFLNIECSERPIYRGEAAAAEVVAWLDSQGFAQDSPICSHDDVMFVRKGLK